MKYSIYLLVILLPFMGVAQNPGGISTNIQLWLKADDGALNSGVNATDGQAVNTWKDKTNARTNDATDDNLAPPTFRDNSADYINYNPIVEFDGVNDGLDFGNDYIYSSGKGSQDGMTWFAVVEPDNASTNKTCQYIADFGSVGNAGYGFRYGSSNYGFYTSPDYSGAFDKALHPFGTDPNLLRFTIDFGKNQTFNFNGAPPSITNTIGTKALTAKQINEKSYHISNEGPFTIGQQSKKHKINNNLGRRFDGNIAELIGFSADLSENSGADISRIESYLSIKYGITRDNSAGSTAGDYLASSGSILWDASITPSFHNDIIGIGRDDNSDLTQNQSHQLDDISRIYLSTLNASNSGNAGSFSTNNQFLLMGHNTKDLKSKGSKEFPSTVGIFSRVEREWKITNTSFNGTFSLDITLDTSPITASDLRLLVNSDDNLSGGTLYNPTISVAGNTVTISGLSNTEIPMNSTSYFTIVSLESRTPLSIEPTAKPVNSKDFKVTGIIRHASTQKGMSLKIEITDTKTEKLLMTIKSDQHGKYQAILEKGKQYSFNILEPKFHEHNGKISTPALEDPTGIQENNIWMKPYKKGDEIKMPPLYFIVSTDTLIESSLPALEKLTTILKENPEIQISIEGHTSSEGSTESNDNLSEARAKRIKTILTEHNIKKSRLKTVGWGGRKPKVKNLTEEDRKMNRRVEFIILE